MHVENKRTTWFRGWHLDPFEELQRVWKAVMDGAQIGVPHVVGKARVKDGVVSGLELSVILHEKERECSFRDGDEVYFMVPARPEEGIDGIYVRINRALVNAR
ncbi:hypothetical protein [Thermococcus sp.]|uniref:hypothetical protein n=1 Tax=Thermococcus sp. TaxID=35749 RepID=UPI002612591D|nr:hypothetical protein [Thermococcus sp.]